MVRSWHPNVVAEAPGRLELLGNHVDYNGGLVLAGAVDRVLAIASRPERRTGGSRVLWRVTCPASHQLDPGVGSRRLAQRQPGESGGPASYTSGVIAALLAHGHPVNDGMRLAIAGNGAARVRDELVGRDSAWRWCSRSVSVTSAGPRRLSHWSREAEHRRGSPVGAMDQSASVAGGIILFDGRHYQQHPDVARNSATRVCRGGLGCRARIVHVLVPSPGRGISGGVTWLRANRIPGAWIPRRPRPADWQATRGSVMSTGLTSTADASESTMWSVRSTGCATA